MKILAFFFFLSFPLTSNACEALSLETLNQSESYLKWTTTYKKTQIPEDKGSVLLVHGLNNNNQIFSELEAYFLKNGYNVLNTALYGHRGSSREMSAVRLRIWKKQIEEHVCYLKSKSNKPIIAVGYSLGSLLVTDYSLGHPKDFSKIILFAFPLTLSDKANLIKKTFFLGGGFPIPSFNLRKYRAEGSTSIAAYKALMNIVREVNREMKASTTAGPQGLVFLHGQDETLNAKSVQEKLNEFSFSKNWNVHLFNEKNQSEDNHEHGANHLMIDSYSLGEVWWNTVLQTLNSELKN